MMALFLILIPFIGGLLSFFIRNRNAVKGFSLLVSLSALVVAVAACCGKVSQTAFSAEWLPMMGSSFTLSMDGMSKMLCLLTGIAYPVIFIATYKNNYENAHSFYGWMLLSMTGMLGVFLAADALLFYFFWELALIPAYFLCSIWGGEKRIQVTFKFFIYTFLGSLLMLVGIIYIYFANGQNFSIASFYNAGLSASEQGWLFWLFFIAFAIKMPVFPFHTWQPDTYEQSPTAVTMVLSGVMVKMGVFAVVRWLLPVFPLALPQYSYGIIVFSVVGMLYASLIAIKQNDIKRLIAYSSIAHIGLMCASIFANNNTGLQGVMIQMFNHGIVVIGLWIVADAIEQKLGTRKFSELGGLAQKAPILAILFLILSFANIALPLTNAFVGEFLMFNGLFTYNVWLAGIAGISIILAAVYTLLMVQKIFYGNTVSLTENAKDTNGVVIFALSVLVVIVIVLGVFPQPLIQLTNDTVKALTIK